MKQPANPVTTEDAAKFHSYIEKWQTLLGLTDWRLLKGGKGPNGVMANVTISIPDRCATYRIGPHFGNDAVTDFTLEQTALHELIHVLLSPYKAAIKAKSSDDILMGEEHKIIHTLERLLVKP